MNENNSKATLQRIKRGTLSINDALETLKTQLFEDIRFTDTRGFFEVIWGEGKSATQIINIMKKIPQKTTTVLVTRVDSKKAGVIKKSFPKAQYYPRSRTLTLIKGKIEQRGRGIILVVSAGTSDIPVAEEAVITAEVMGNRVDHIYDVGVAGIHRLMSHKDKIRGANVIVVVAGMEGALPSVVGGLVSRPVIAVPTSIGYGASFGGIAALLGMLNSCSAGVSVVNIDNGFGAGYMANLINQG